MLFYSFSVFYLFIINKPWASYFIGVLFTLFWYFEQVTLLRIFSYFLLFMNIFVIIPFLFYSVFSPESKSDSFEKKIETYCQPYFLSLFYRLKQDNRKQYQKFKKLNSSKDLSTSFNKKKND